MSETKKKRGRKKGTTKTGGRKKGTPNKKSLRLDKALHEAGFDYVEEFITAFHTLDSTDRIEALKVLLPYLAPKLKEMEVEEEPENTTNTTDLQNQSTADLLKMIKK